MTDDPTPPEPQFIPPVALEETYDSCFIGHTVSPDRTPRFVYSLVLLARREQARAHISPEHARKSVWEMVTDLVRTHGDKAPLFVDDEISRGAPAPGAEIIRSAGHGKKIITLS